jgi:hypothetical protein
MSGSLPVFLSGRGRWPRLAAHFGAYFLMTFASLVVFGGATVAFAQSVGPDEIVNAQTHGSADGATKQLALTDAQKMTIYKAVVAQHVHRTATAPGGIPAVVGAMVPSTAELAHLPDQAARQADAANAMDLKYAMVEGDVVVVDPIGMRVIDVIHGITRP